MATITGIAAAIGLCAEVVFNPLIEETAALVPIAAVAAPIVAVIAGMITVGLILFFWWWCRPNWCNDWFVLIWQVLISVGFVFVYFGTCPACALTLLPIGIVLIVLGILAFIAWVSTCRPTLCKIFFEIGSLGLVQLVVGWLEFILGACVWLWGWLILAIWQLAINAIGWIGTVIACQVNPND
jgi:hypothetical protein